MNGTEQTALLLKQSQGFPLNVLFADEFTLIIRKMESNVRFREYHMTSSNTSFKF